LGDLDRETVRFLDRIAREREKRRASGELRSHKTPPLVRAVSEKRSLKPGTILVREHEGLLHRVTVVEGGFAWNETTYRSRVGGRAGHHRHKLERSSLLRPA
jgi:Protein of unknown function (DUF2924)